MDTVETFADNAPGELGYVMPAEWSPHRACWMAWPSEHVQWQDLAAVERDYAAVAAAIAKFEAVVMVADPSSLARARELCGAGIEVLEMRLDDSWMRDTGPSFLRHPDSGALAGVDAGLWLCVVLLVQGDDAAVERPVELAVCAPVIELGTIEVDDQRTASEQQDKGQL